MVAVADGVGGWADSGVDPALYSRALCRNINSIYLSSVERNDTSALSSVLNKPQDLLIEAAGETRERGSSTAVV